MTTNFRSASASDDRERAFVADVERHLGRTLDAAQTALAVSLIDDKSAALVARELDGAPIADPKKIRPEHADTADEPGAAPAKVLD